MSEFDDQTRAILASLAGNSKTHAKILATITLTPSGKKFIMRGLKRLLKAFDISQHVLEVMSGGSPTWWAANEELISRKDATALFGGLSRIAGKKVEFSSLLDKNDRAEKAPALLRGARLSRPRGKVPLHCASDRVACPLRVASASSRSARSVLPRLSVWRRAACRRSSCGSSTGCPRDARANLSWKRRVELRFRRCGGECRRSRYRARWRLWLCRL